jgi:hypothetical protein
MSFEGTFACKRKFENPETSCLHDNYSMGQNSVILARLHTLNIILETLKCTDCYFTQEETDDFTNTVFLIDKSIKDQLSAIKSEMYTTILVVGCSGSGKTHVLNNLLRGGLSLSPTISPLNEEQIRDRLIVKVIDNHDNGKYWSPVISATCGSLLESSSVHSHFLPRFPKDCKFKQFDILPEGDMFCTTKVPVHIFYGKEVKISISYTTAAQVDVYLRKLLIRIKLLLFQVSFNDIIKFPFADIYPYRSAKKAVI